MAFAASPTIRVDMTAWPPPHESDVRFPSHMLLAGLDGSYHPESGGTLMGAAMSVAKNVASNTSSGEKAAAVENGTRKATNGENTAAHPQGSTLQVDASSDANGAADAVAPVQAKTPGKAEGAASGRKSSFMLGVGGGANQRQSPERKTVTDRRGFGAGGQAPSDRRPSGVGVGASFRAGSPAPDGVSSIGQGSLDGSGGDKQRARKKSSET